MKTFHRAGTVLVCFLLSAGSAAARQPAAPRIDVASVRTLPFPGVALGLNDQGDVVGHSNYRAFLWTSDSRFVDLGTLPGLPLCEAAAVNNRRDVVGWCWGGSVPGSRAFLWTTEQGMRDIGRGAAFAVNDLGEVAGGGEADDGLQASWRWAAGERQLLGLSGRESMAMAINEWGHIAASGPSPDALGIFVWRAGAALEDLGVAGIALDINDIDEISTSAPTWNPNLLRPGQAPIDIPMPAGKYGSARGVNNMSIVVGTATDNASEAQFAFMWTGADGYAEIGEAGSAAEKMNNAGEIAGSMTGQDGMVYPAVWRVRTPVDVRLDAVAAALRAHIGRGVMRQGPADGILNQMDRIARAAADGAGPAEVGRMLRSLSSHARGLMTAGQLPAIDAWLLRTIDLAVSDLEAAD